MGDTGTELPSEINGIAQFSRDVVLRVVLSQLEKLDLHDREWVVSQLPTLSRPNPSPPLPPSQP